MAIILLKPFNDLETPSVLIDLDKMEQQHCQAMQARCDDLGINFRPHIKRTKYLISPAVKSRPAPSASPARKSARRKSSQLPVSAIFRSPTISSGGEKRGDWPSSRSQAAVTVTVDSKSQSIDGIAEAAQEADVTISMMVELVSLGERTGTTPAAALELARHIMIATDNLRFAGVMIYPSDATIRPRLLETLGTAG